MYILIKRTAYVNGGGTVLESDTKAYYSNTKRDVVRKLFSDYDKLIKYIDKRSSLYKLGEDKAISKNYAWCAGNGTMAEVNFTECSMLRGEKFYPNYWATCVKFEITKARAIPPQIDKS